MKINTIKKVYFSPAGTTQRVIDSIADGFNLPTTEVDLLRNPLALENDMKISNNDLVIVAMPVYYGRIPEIASKMIANLKGENTLAIAVVVYGNREYDDSLLELRNILTANGFTVIGAGAFVAQHSLFDTVATDRPNAQDGEIAVEFAKNCKEIIDTIDLNSKKIIAVKGNENYCPMGNVPFAPTVNDSCNECGLCDDICPVGAINSKATVKSDESLCISCSACIANCPQKARSYTGDAYETKKEKFTSMCSAYKTPELFYI